MAITIGLDPELPTADGCPGAIPELLLVAKKPRDRLF